MNIGSHLSYIIGFTLAANVKDEAKTASPSPIFKTLSAKCNPAVAELRATAFGDLV